MKKEQYKEIFAKKMHSRDSIEYFMSIQPQIMTVKYL